MPDVKKLEAWQVSMKLAVQVYRVTEQLPKHELYGLTAQIRRSAVSIPSNIAEGYGRNNRGEYVQFLGVASGSMAELETQLLLARDLGYLTLDERLMDQVDHVTRLIAALKNSLR